MAVTRAPHQPERIVVLVVLKFLPSVHQLGEGCAGKRACVPVSVPQQKIIQRRKHPASSKVSGDADQAHPTITRFDEDTDGHELSNNLRIDPRRIPRCAMGDNLCRVVINFRVHHSERTKDSVVHESREGLVADDASNAARLFPKNANLAAAVALAGIGFERTQIELVADPNGTGNIGMLEAVSDSSTLTVTVSSTPSSNPKTSANVGASVIAALRNSAALIRFV